MADFENGDVVRLGAQFLLNGTDALVNVYTLQINSGGPMAFAAAAQDFADYLNSLYGGFLAYWPTTFQTDRISVKNETQDTVWGAIAWKTVLTGTNINDSLPPQVALLGWGRTPLSRVQIRKYFGVFCENHISNGLWASGLRFVVDTAMQYVIAPQTQPNGLVLQGVAYNKALARATTALTVTTAEVPVIQRRRRVGRGA